MIRSVLDANVLASGAVAPEGPVAELMGAWLLNARFVVVLSPRILAELDRTLRKPRFAQRLSNEDRGRYLDSVRSAAEVVEPMTMPGDLPSDSQEDAHLFAAAIEGDAEFLVTGDHAVLRVGSYAGISVIRPRDFMRFSAS